MDPEEYANFKVTAEMNPDQYSAIASVLIGWVDDHKDDADLEIRKMVEDIQSVAWKRTQ